MPRIDPQTLKPSDIYGGEQIDNTLTMGERIRKRFKPTDTVKVHNLTNFPIQWQWLEESDESYVIQDDLYKIVTRNDPGVWRLEAGEQDILQGSCAYLMIEALYKQMSVMKTGIILHPLDEREIKNFGFDDPQKQEEMIDLIFRGKVTPQMMAEAAANSMGDMRAQVLEHLPDLANERSEYSKRMGAQQQMQHPMNAPAPAPAPLVPEPSAHTELGDLGSEFMGPATGGFPEGAKTIEPPLAPKATTPHPAAPDTKDKPKEEVKKPNGNIPKPKTPEGAKTIEPDKVTA